MRAIILAAGRGSRMGNLTDNVPKGLIELKGRPLLHWQTSALNAVGISDITLVTGYQHQKFCAEGLPTMRNLDWSTTNMVASLLCAKELIDQPTIVSYSDIVYDASIVSSLVSSHGDLCVAYDKHWLDLWRARFPDPLSDAESFKVNDRNHIIEIGDRVKQVTQIEGQFIGLLRFNPESISWVEDLIQTDSSLLSSLDMTALLKLLISSGRTIQGVETKEKWCEIDSETDLSVAETIVTEGSLKCSPGSTRS